MKQIFFIRHAKSSWSDAGMQDIERPLNPRGLRDAPIMARQLNRITQRLDKLIISPSQRTKETSKYFCDAFNIDLSDRLIWPDLYHGSVDQYYEVLTGLSDDLDVVAIIGHNPTTTIIANENNTEYIDNVATCGIVEYTYHGEWLDFNIADANFVQYIYPKMFL